MRNEPVLSHGVWRTTIDADRLPEVMETLLTRLQFTLLLVAGEDRRRSTGRMHVHYLCGRHDSHELLHLDVSVAGRHAVDPIARRAVISRLALRA